MTVNVVVPLHNLLTQLAVDKRVAMRLLMCLEKCELVYRSYRQDSLDEKVKKMSMTISKRNLPGFTDQPQKTPAIILKEKEDRSSKKVGEARTIMIMEIIKELVMDLKQILAHSVLSGSPQYAFCISNVLSASPHFCSGQQFNIYWRDWAETGLCPMESEVD